MLFTEYYQEFWPLQKLYINQFCFYRPNLFFPQVLSLSVSDLKRVRSAKQWNPLIDLRPMAVEYICSENACWLLSLHNTLLYFVSLPFPRYDSSFFFFFHVLKQTIILGTLTYLLELLPGKTGKLWSSNLPD